MSFASSSRASFARAVIGLVVMSVVVSCSSEPPSDVAPVPVDRPVPVFSSVWSADAGVDVFGRGAELVRATLEAGSQTFDVGAERSYPGYAEAVGAPRDQDDPNFYDRFTWAERPDHLGPPLAATFFEHIASLEESDTRVSAVVCDDTVYEKPELGNSYGYGMSVAFRVELSRSGGVVGLAGVKDADAGSVDPRAHRPPTWDVFGDWTIDQSYILNVFEPGSTQVCVPWWLQQEPTYFPSLTGNTVSSPPGAVERTMPVAVQFPEWIGPANTL